MPRAARAQANASPMPDDAPVTIAAPSNRLLHDPLEAAECSFTVFMLFAPFLHGLTEKKQLPRESREEIGEIETLDTGTHSVFPPERRSIWPQRSLIPVKTKSRRGKPPLGVRRNFPSRIQPRLIVYRPNQ